MKAAAARPPLASKSPLGQLPLEADVYLVIPTPLYKSAKDYGFLKLNYYVQYLWGGLVEGQQRNLQKCPGLLCLGLYLGLSAPKAISLEWLDQSPQLL